MQDYVKGALVGLLVKQDSCRGQGGGAGGEKGSRKGKRKKIMEGKGKGIRVREGEEQGVRGRGKGKLWRRG